MNAIHTMISLNCYTSTLLTKCFVDDFKNRYQNRKSRSLVIQNCAGASIAPTPYLQTYSATKIFNEFMAMGLYHELKSEGIDVMGIKSFGIKNEDKAGDKSMFDKFLNVTPEKSIQTSLDKCQSGVHYGNAYHEVLGTFLINILDMLPFEGRMFVMSDMAKKFIFD